MKNTLTNNTNSENLESNGVKEYYSEEIYKAEPRDYALNLVDEGIITSEQLALILIKSMSHDDVRWAIEANFLDPESLEEDN